jgi:hypothetical protein
MPVLSFNFFLSLHSSLLQIIPFFIQLRSLPIDPNSDAISMTTMFWEASDIY